MPSNPAIAAEQAMYEWRGAETSDPVRIGSEAHKTLFCRMLLDTHNPYKPAVMEWPPLDADSLKRVTSLPIWDIAVQTEGRASINVKTFAELGTDPLLRQALDMDAAEEARHKVVLSTLVAAYGIQLAAEPAYPPPADPLWAWLVTGYSECIDSFFAFGLFEMARRSGYFPAELVETFEPVIQEEARHILFFANWVAWHRKSLPLLSRLRFVMKELAVWGYLIWERIGIARGLDAEGVASDANFTLSGGHGMTGMDLSPKAFFELCLAENDIRLKGFDNRLLRPEIVPKLVRLARRFMPK